MIPTALWFAFVPSGALALSIANPDPGFPFGDILDAALAHWRQFKADLDGSPDRAEHIRLIVNSTVSA